MSRPAELAFLDELLRIDVERFHRANWLKSPFEEMRWTCEFPRGGRFELNFEISLPSGRRLSECPNILQPIKYWLLTSTNFESQGKLGASPLYEYNIIGGVLTWIDYLLLNAHEFNLEENGLTEITRDRFKGVFAKLSSSRNKSVALYEWESRVLSYVESHADEVSDKELSKTLAEHPELANISEIRLEDYPNLSADSIYRMRAWLQLNDFYRHSRTDRFHLNARKLSNILYQNTLRGVASIKPRLPLFNAGRLRDGEREFKALPTTRRGDLEGGTSLSAGLYRKCFAVLEELHKQHLCVDLLPSPSVIALAAAPFQSKQEGRFSTVPPVVVFDALRGSVEYQLEYGDALLESYSHLMRTARLTGRQMATIPSEEFIKCLDPRLEALGITCWKASKRVRNELKQYLPQVRDAQSLASRCQSLYFCIQVLYGAAAVVVGALMARRQGELLDLPAEHALDITSSYLIFSNEKSSKMLLGERETEARPIASIAARAVQNLTRVQSELIANGYLIEYTDLFCYPSANDGLTLVKASAINFNEALDALCDFAELPVLDGLRYYLRQHQLRRFFCMLFFWHTSFGGLDTLRWFLGHHDIEQVYRYISESTPGRILNSVKAQHAATNISSYDNLARFLQTRFGSTDFALLDVPELENHILSLIEDGVVSVEPQFFKTREGIDYRILVTVK